MKKFLAVALATVMVLSVSSAALAYGEGRDGRGNGRDIPGGTPGYPPGYCPKGHNSGACSVPW